MDAEFPRMVIVGLSPRFIAARDGERFYLGNPCKNCRGVERYTSTGNCRVCQMKSTRLSRLRKKEREGRALREAPVMIQEPQQPGENSGT